MNRRHSRSDARRRRWPVPPVLVAMVAGALALLTGLALETVRTGDGSAGPVATASAVTLSKDRGLRGIEPSSPLSMARRRVRTRTRQEDIAPPRPPLPTRGTVGRISDPRSAQTTLAMRTASAAFLSYGSTHRRARTGVISSHSTTHPPPHPG